MCWGEKNRQEPRDCLDRVFFINLTNLKRKKVKKTSTQENGRWKMRGRAKIQGKCSLTVKLRSARIQDSSLDETTRKPGLPRVPETGAGGTCARLLPRRSKLGNVPLPEPIRRMSTEVGHPWDSDYTFHIRSGMESFRGPRPAGSRQSPRWGESLCGDMA